MSEGPDLSARETLAAEHALGLLGAGDRAEAEARMARDSAFATLVDDWRARLTPMLDAMAPVEPRAAVWAGVERALGANDNAAARRRLRFWRGATLGSLGLAAASLAFAVLVVSRSLEPAPPPAAPPMLNASLMTPGEGSHPMFVAAYDPVRQALIITSLARPGADPGHGHQLWVIPADGQPHSLGMIAPGASKSMPMPKAMAPMFTPGAAIVASLEPPGGSPTGRPSGPMAAVGKLGRI
jgi:anti-sigma-K factor RskA